MKLEELNLRNTQITNRSIEGLKQMKALRRLEVNNTGVTEAACAQLIKEIPDLKVWGRRRKEVHLVSDDPKEVGLVEAILGDRRWVVKDKATDTVRSIEVPRDTQKPGKWMTHLKGLHNLKLLRLPNSTADDDVACSSRERRWRTWMSVAVTSPTRG